MQYNFKGPEHIINNPPHKSSKSATPNKRTYPSTLQRMKQLAKDHKPSTTFELVNSELEEGENMSIGRLPCSERQVSDIRRRLFSQQPIDDLAVMMEKCKCTERGTPQFVRSVQAAPQPLCVSHRFTAETDTALLYRPRNFSILHIDPTFNLGAFYVTPVVFLHFCL